MQQFLINEFGESLGKKIYNLQHKDYVIYGSMRKVKFLRTETLGIRSKHCDFCFLNKKKIKEA